MKSSLNPVRILVAVADKGNLSKAAKILNISRSAASKNILALEKSLGVTLLNRTTRSISFTEAGKQYVEDMRPVIEAALRAEMRVAALTHEPHGTLVISATRIYARMVLSAILVRFLDANPGISVDLRVTDELSDPVTDNIDVFFRTGTITHQNMTAIKLEDITFMTVASQEYLTRFGRPEKPDDLLNHNCLNFRYPEDNSMFRWRFQTGEEQRYLNVGGNLQSTDAEILRSLALAGSGIAQLPGQLVSDDVQNKRLVQLFPKSSCVSNQVYLCYDAGRRQDPKITRLKAMIPDLPGRSSGRS